MYILKKIREIILIRLYAFDSVILYRKKNKKIIESPVNVVKATSENIKDILNFQDEMYLKVFEHFINNRDIGYLGYMKKKCIHRSWVVVRSNAIVNLHPLIKWKLSDQEVFIHYCETAPIARGRNVYPYVINKIADDFADKKVLICVDEKNFASIKGVTKAGFEPIQKITVLAFAGLVLRFKKDIKEGNFH